MKRSLRYIILASLTTITSMHAFAQDNSCAQRTVPISVEGANGELLHQITAADLTAKVGGKEARVLSVKPDERPHRIVIVMDASGSMKKDWGRMMSLALGLTKDDLPNTKVAVVLFNLDILETLDFSKDETEIVERLHKLRNETKLLHGATALYDAMLYGLQILGSATSADSLYVISDGQDNASSASLEKTLQKIEQNGVRVFASVILDEGRDRKRAAIGRRTMEKFASYTGGEVVEPFGQGYPKGEKEIAHFAERMNWFHRRMIGDSLLELELAAPLAKNRSVEVQASRTGSLPLEGARLHFPTEVVACKPTAKAH